MKSKTNNKSEYICATEKSGEIVFDVWERSYIFDKSALPTKITALGRELLYSPMRLVGEANGIPIEWESDQSFLMCSDDSEKETAIGCMQSDCIIVNTAFSCESDGGVTWDIKVMPRGLTVPMVFGVEPCSIKGWELTKLYLEIPLKKEFFSLYGMWPKPAYINSRLGKLESSGQIPEGGLTTNFTPVLWIGDEKTGIQIVSESDEFWVNGNKNEAIEIVDEIDHFILRLRLLDGLPKEWTKPSVDSPIINYRFGLMATPVKKWDDGFFDNNILHIDCFVKIKGSYLNFLTSPDEEYPTVLDRIEKSGVNLIVLHEKWNKIQNYWKTDTETARDIKKIVELCHERGIRVIPYFGYEISSANSQFVDMCDEVMWHKDMQTTKYSGWYREPWQRAVKTCFKSRWSNIFADGVLEAVDRFGFDGVYLDTTGIPMGCINQRHGCGYEENGIRYPTYPIFETRRLFKKIYKSISERGGVVNVHQSGPAIPFITSHSDFLWLGEDIQTTIREKGASYFSLDYFRAEYLGRNIGIPVQFIVYEFPGIWDFNMALSLALIHGVYPRPNSIGAPLRIMERIWRIILEFGIKDAKFKGYWENEDQVRVTDVDSKVSYYEKLDVDGKIKRLIYLSNPTNRYLHDVRAVFTDKVSLLRDLDNNVTIDEILTDLPAFSLRIYEVEK
jgi:hypothetical protein